MKKTAAYLTIMVLFTVAATTQVKAHCQVPCGIYDDQMRIHMMKEHVVTIAKAMKEIQAGQNANQTTRWVMNKEKHAEALSNIVTYYFMAQRIKPGSDKYMENLKTLHEILISAMKAKQTTDGVHTQKLNELIHAFERSYLGDKPQH